MAFRTKTKAVAETAESRDHRLSLIDDLTFEVVPLKSLDAAVDSLPAGAAVSVTASPAKGLDVTVSITSDLLAKGYRAIPHISARMVRDHDHLDELVAWFQLVGLKTMFLVGGDAEEPGIFDDAPQLLEALLERDHGLDTIGVTAYPDGHALISDDALHRALFAKQQMLADAGLNGYASTQMCFDPQRIASWLEAERAHGLTLPIHLGLPGVVDKARLLKMGVRLGIGQSLSFLRKNRSAVTKMMTATNYDPNDLLVPLSDTMRTLDVSGLHMFTFNNVAETDDWRRACLDNNRS